MLRRIFYSLYSLIFWVVILAAQVTSDTTIKNSAPPKPQIYHNIPKFLPLNGFATLTCVVETSDLRLKSVKIFLRCNTEQNFKEFPMYYARGTYCLDLIPEMLQGKRLYYFIIAEFDHNIAVAFPPDKPNDNPVSVPLVATGKK